MGILGRAYKWDSEVPVKAWVSDEVDQLEKSIEKNLIQNEVRRLAQDCDHGQLHILRREALILLYSHLLKLDIQDVALQKRASILWTFDNL